jgi:hypothetical protein
VSAQARVAAIFCLRNIGALYGVSMYSRADEESKQDKCDATWRCDFIPEFAKSYRAAIVIACPHA